MKMMSATLPIVILSWILVAVWGLGMLAVKASATSTQLSIDMLHQHLKVAQLHEKLMLLSRARLETHLDELPIASPSTGDATARSSYDRSPRPWPEGAARDTGRSANPAMTYLENGLTAAQPTLSRLLEQFDTAVETE